MKTKNLRKLKRRIKFLENFQKITKSVSLISAVKYQKVYLKIKNVIRNIFYLLSIFEEINKRHKLDISKIKLDKNKKELIIVIASDRGLAGAFDYSIFRKTEEFLSDKENFYLGTIGSKAEKYFRKKYNLLFSFSKFENILPESFARELLSYLDFLISNNKITDIYVIRPNLISTGFLVEILKIYPHDLEVIKDLLGKIKPRLKEFEEIKEEKRFKWNFEYILEPSSKVIIETLLKQVFFSALYILILQSQASLELTRTITMRKANENAKEIREKENLNYNKLRQQKITEELIDLRR